MASPKLLVVFGATGIQGGSVIETVISDPTLSKQYTVRGITRDPSSSAAQALAQKGIEVVAGDLNDRASLCSALKGAHTVFAVTVTIYHEPGGFAKELEQGKALADEAVAAGAEHIIWSSQRSPVKGTEGKLPVPSFDIKAQVEEYIRTLPIHSVFFAPGAFMENLLTFQKPQPIGGGAYGIFGIQRSEAVIPWIYAGESGKYVGAYLADPKALDGKFLAASSDLRTTADVARAVSEATGKPVSYIQIPEDKYRGFLPPGAADSFVNMFKWFDTVGYYGHDTETDVEWTIKNAALGKLTSVEEFLSINTPKLE